MDNLKGNLVVGQSGGPTAVINSSVCGVVQEALCHDHIGEIYGMHHGILGLIHEDLFDLRREDPAMIAGLRRTPSSALGSCRHKMDDNDCERILQVCQSHNIHYFMYIGGGDSMDTADKIFLAAAENNFDMRVFGIPKTIDNDLPITDHCPGYGSAARFEAMTCSEIVRDTIALRHTEFIKIFETMGRNTGWLAASTALAGEFALDLIYLPERSFI